MGTVANSVLALVAEIGGKPGGPRAGLESLETGQGWARQDKARRGGSGRRGGRTAFDLRR